MKAVLTQKKLFFSLEWESKTLKKHKVLLSQLANKQVRLITLLELLPLTRWQEEDKDAYLQINAVASELAFYLQQLAEFVAGKAQQLPILPECLEQELQHRLQLALASATIVASTTDLDAAATDGEVPQGFALTGYSWLIYQLAIAVEALYEDIAIIEIAYNKQPASQITSGKAD